MLDRVSRHLLDPTGLAVGRTAVGLALLARPTALPAALGVDRETRERMSWAVQMLGAREVALGLGALTARTGRRSWLAGGLLSDAMDAVAITAAVRQGRIGAAAGGAVAAVAAGAVVVQADALRRR